MTLDRVLVTGEWYRLVATGALYESEFETLLYQQAAYLFPEYKAVRFKVTVHSEYGSHRPDLALIDLDYRHWWVVEVERSDHSLLGHVIPQVLCFATGAYTKKHAETVVNAEPSLDRLRLAEMFKGDPPGVLVVADRFNPDWSAHIVASGGVYMAAPVYRNGANQQIYGTRGGLPQRDVQVLTRCERASVIPSMLSVASPAALPFSEGEQREITFRDGVMLWQRLDLKDQVLLAPVGANGLPDSARYFVLKQGAETLVLELA